MERNDPAIDLTQSLGFMLLNAACRVKDGLRKGFESQGYDVTPDQFAVLIRLWQGDGLSQTELCERTLKTKSNMTRILDSMEKKELVSRRANTEDRRSLRIYLTEKGKSLETGLTSAALALHQKIFEKITPEDQRTLLRMLRCIHGSSE